MKETVCGHGRFLTFSDSEVEQDYVSFDFAVSRAANREGLRGRVLFEVRRWRNEVSRETHFFLRTESRWRALLRKFRS